MKSICLFNALMLSLVSGDWSPWYRGSCPLSLTNYTLSSTDSSAYITGICVTTDSTPFHHLLSITATYSNGDVSGPFGGASAVDSISNCFAVIEENECITNGIIYTGYYLNSLQFGTSSSRSSDKWGVSSGNDVYFARDDEGTCLSKIEVTATSAWNRLVSIRFGFDAFQGALFDIANSHSLQNDKTVSTQPATPTQTRIHSTGTEPTTSSSFDIGDNSTVHLAERGCDGIQYLMDNVALYLPAGVCSVSYDEEAEDQYSTMLQCNEDGTNVMFNTYSTTDCTGAASFSIAYADVIASDNYRIFCGGNACNYGIRREYPTTDCSDKREEVKDKYSDNVFVIGADETDATDAYCRNMGGLSMRYGNCIDGVSIAYTVYSDANCVDNGKTLTQSFVNGECDGENSHQYEIVCGVADVSHPQQDVSISTTTDTVEKISMETTDIEEATAASNGWMLILVFVAICLGFCVYFWFKRKWRNAKNNLVHHIMDSAVEAVVHSDHHGHDHHHHEHPHDYHAHHEHHHHPSDHDQHFHGHHTPHEQQSHGHHENDHHHQHVVRLNYN